MHLKSLSKVWLAGLVAGMVMCEVRTSSIAVLFAVVIVAYKIHNMSERKRGAYMCTMLLYCMQLTAMTLSTRSGALANPTVYVITSSRTEPALKHVAAYHLRHPLAQSSQGCAGMPLLQRVPSTGDPWHPMTGQLYDHWSAQMPLLDHHHYRDAATQLWLLHSHQHRCLLAADLVWECQSSQGWYWQICQVCFARCASFDQQWVLQAVW